MKKRRAILNLPRLRTGLQPLVLNFSPASGGLAWGSFLRYRLDAGGVSGTIRPPRVPVWYPLPGVGTRRISDRQDADRAATDRC